MTSTSTPISDPPEGVLTNQLGQISLNAENKLRFHPDFKHPMDGTMFQTPDGTAFHFSWALLALMSSFFNDLRSVPSKSDNKDAVIIPLPSATAPALAFVFGSIKSSLRCEKPLQCPDKDHWDAILTIADAYDLPYAMKCLNASFKAKVSPLDSPFDAFALAVMAKDSEGVQQLSQPILERNRSDFRFSWAERALGNHVPHGIAILNGHYTNWDNHLESFERGRFHRRYSHFGRGCGKKACRPCHNFERWGGDFMAFLRSVLIDVKTTLSPLNHSANVADHLPRIDFGCEECDSRILETVSDGIRYFLDNKPVIKAEL